jgi:hypothetical protein
MNINEDYFGLDLGEQFVGHAKSIERIMVK